MADSTSDSLFNPTEEHRLLRQMVADFARREVEPQAAEQFGMFPHVHFILYKKTGQSRAASCHRSGRVVIVKRVAEGSAGQ